MNNNTKDQEYKVLARKYRPQRFDELIGQEILVQTLTNAINKNRIAHAYLLTGVRGEWELVEFEFQPVENVSGSELRRSLPLILFKILYVLKSF